MDYDRHVKAASNLPAHAGEVDFLKPRKPSSTTRGARARGHGRRWREGINLQRAHLMINYDLPWNPNRIEQRFGRIHRIGQIEPFHLWDLVAVETCEGEVNRPRVTNWNLLVGAWPVSLRCAREFPFRPHLRTPHGDQAYVCVGHEGMLCIPAELSDVRRSDSGPSLCRVLVAHR